MIRINGEYDYLIVHGFDIPSMCAEFDPGPSWGHRFFKIKVRFNEPEIKEIQMDEVKEIYKNLEGRQDRIDLWKAIKYEEHVDSEEYYNDNVY